MPSKPGPAAAVEVIHVAVGISAGPQKARDILVSIQSVEGWERDKTAALLNAEKWESRFLNLLRERANDFNELGRPVAYAFNSSTEKLIQGAAFEEPADPPEVVIRKRARARFSSYLSSFGALTPRQFEKLCKGLLGLMGASQVTLTQYGKDEGIDFFGKLKMSDLVSTSASFPDVTNQMSVWLIGQAKHYKRVQAATPDIRELVGSTVLALTPAGFEPKYEELTIRVSDPVISLFATTGTISRDGWHLLKRSGVVGMDGEMIADYLSAKEVGMLGGVFDETQFLSWVDAIA